MSTETPPASASDQVASRPSARTSGVVPGKATEPTLVPGVSISPFPGLAEPNGLMHGIKSWLLADLGATEDKTHHAIDDDDAPKAVSKHKIQAHTHPWWQVMCLTGVDYFSTLGYQPGIAFLAAGALSPIATIILVIVTLFGALPIYQKVANESPHGEGSILMLRGLLSRWRGKTFILFLLGFAATDFIITITLSAADATAHLVENPILAPFLHEARVPITLFLIAILGAVFLKGFNEAIGVAVVLVISYLILNAIVIGVGLLHVLESPKVLFDWQGSLSEQFGNPIHMVIAATLLFPKLALGLSGFETGVAVMPLLKGDHNDDPDMPVGRIRNARKLLTVAAVIMSVYLITSSIVTTTLIPAPEFEVGGKANGRALAYLSYEFLGPVFGSVYDAVTIAILWFAGASAMAGLLNLIPNYLPKYGMAPQFIASTRPLVLVLTTISFLVTILFNADVDAQGGAYATGVLVLMMSGAFAVTLKYREEGRKVMVWFFSFITFVFIYTLIVNVLERPDGVKIASVFIGSIIAVSMLSRAWRSTELRTSISTITADEEAMRIIEEYRESDPNQRQGSPRRELIHLICDRPRGENSHLYDEKRAAMLDDENIARDHKFCFLEVIVGDTSDFISDGLIIRGHRIGENAVLRVEATTIPNTIAAVLLWIRDTYDITPHAYLSWTEGHPLTHAARFLFFGEGETAPITREILREAETVPMRRPHVHVG